LGHLSETIKLGHAVFVGILFVNVDLVKDWSLEVLLLLRYLRNRARNNFKL